MSSGLCAKTHSSKPPPLSHESVADHEVKSELFSTISQPAKSSRSSKTAATNSSGSTHNTHFTEK